MGVWDQVTLVSLSDFGRTLVPNTGGGSDHAWAGHYFVMGGSVDGGQIHGQYPSDITDAGPLNVGGGRGRMIPTLSWESMLNSIVEWLGVDGDDNLDKCMPNRNTPGTTLFRFSDVFVSGPTGAPVSPSPTKIPTNFPTAHVSSFLLFRVFHHCVKPCNLQALFMVFSFTQAYEKSHSSACRCTDQSAC